MSPSTMLRMVPLPMRSAHREDWIQTFVRSDQSSGKARLDNVDWR
jgi:hypothetical protein